MSRSCVEKVKEQDDWQRTQVIPPAELASIFPSKGAWAWARRNKVKFGIGKAFRMIGRREIVSPTLLLECLGVSK